MNRVEENAAVVLVARHLPGPARTVIKRLRASPRLRRRLHPIRWGNLRRTKPFSRRYGFDRGTPIDRWMLDRFFHQHSADITGRVLEVGGPAFTSRFGHDITALDIVDIDPRNDEATIIVDLADRGALPAASFDCLILPQTLQYVSNLDVAIHNLWGALAPGGTLLITVPSIAKVDHDLADVDRWRLLPAGLEMLLERSCPDAQIEVNGRGNPTTAIAFLMGAAAEELRVDELAADDPEFPMLIVAVVRRPR